MSGLKETFRSFEFSGTGVTRNMVLSGVKTLKNVVVDKNVFPGPGLDADLVCAACDGCQD